eukprot:2854098-Amphidinium_carterae.1
MGRLAGLAGPIGRSGHSVYKHAAVDLVAAILWRGPPPHKPGKLRSTLCLHAYVLTRPAQF